MRVFLVIFLVGTCLFAQDRSGDPKTSQSPPSASMSAKTASGKNSPVPAPAAPKAAGWQVQEHKAVDGTREVALVLDSETAAGGADSHRAHLAIRCAKHKPEVFINIGDRFEGIPGKTDVVDVQVKFDSAGPVKQRWLAAADLEAAFALSPVALVKRMAESKTFLFTSTSFQKRDTTVTFKMGDLKAKLQPISGQIHITERVVANLRVPLLLDF